MNKLIVNFIILNLKMILKKNLILKKVNFQEKDYLELFNNVKVILIKMNMQLNNVNFIIDHILEMDVKLI